MHALPLIRTILAVILNLVIVSIVSSQQIPTNANSSVLTLFPYADTHNREIDLIHSLFNKTNRSFDQKVYESVRTNANNSMVISYRLVSFAFHYPTGVAHADSFTEMGRPDDLVCISNGISRGPITNEIPVNYIRLSDAKRKSVVANLGLLLGVAPLEKPQEIKYLRRSFRFTYENGWKEN